MLGVCDVVRRQRCERYTFTCVARHWCDLMWHGFGRRCSQNRINEKCWGPLACRRYMCHIADDRSMMRPACQQCLWLWWITEWFNNIVIITIVQCVRYFPNTYATMLKIDQLHTIFSWYRIYNYHIIRNEMHKYDFKCDTNVLSIVRVCVWSFLSALLRVLSP